MGESLLAAHSELDQERQKHRRTLAKLAELELSASTGREELDGALKASAAKDERLAALAAERDALTRSLVAEAGKVHLQISEREQAEEAWHRRYLDLQKRLGEEIEARGREAAGAEELRAQISTLAGQLAKAVQEKDTVALASSTWKQEREKLLGLLKEKEQMISMLNSTFQNMLRKV